MKKSELAAILAAHALWIARDPTGSRAHLSRADLSRADLRETIRGSYKINHGPLQVLGGEYAINVFDEHVEVGWLIPDERYKASLEGEGAWTARVVRAVEPSGLPPHDADFLSRLQLVHDEFRWHPEKFAAEIGPDLLKFAKKEGLDPTKLNAAIAAKEASNG